LLHEHRVEDGNGVLVDSVVAFQCAGRSVEMVRGQR
jgi:hypothetical protein